MNTEYVQIVILKLKTKNTTLLEQFKNLIEKIVHTESVIISTAFFVFWWFLEVL
jgi:hypothetical protein